MHSLATVSRTTKRGLTSTWHFVQCTDGWYAFGGCHRPLVKRFDTVEQLRELYDTYISYGYTRVDVDQQLELNLVVA
jgi:hypothetical protein